MTDEELITTIINFMKEMKNEDLEFILSLIVDICSAE